jgi:leader peptidase (prepilin peptidase)/N-methyltransferase
MGSGLERTWRMQVYIWLVFVFVVGAAVGSFLNVAIARLPLEKSLLWPGSRCGKCYQCVRWFDNIPLLSYLWLRGRCRSCGERFSLGYFAVELLTGLGFVGLFYLEVMLNVHDWPVWNRGWEIRLGFYPLHFWVGFIYHAILFSFLMVASGCDLKGREIPFPLTMTGTIVGLVGSAFLPWPWPWYPAQALPRPRGTLAEEELWRIPHNGLREGIYPWPVWGPLPDWLPPESWQLGLATGLGGMLMGTFLLRIIGFIFSSGLGKEGLGLGDADLMMMAGSFLGWQVVVVAFFLSVVPALFFGIFQVLVHKDNSLPFGPSLAAGTLMACLGWRWIGPFVQPLFFWGQLLPMVAGLGAVVLLVSSLAMRMLRGFANPERPV